MVLNWERFCVEGDKRNVEIGKPWKQLCLAKDWPRGEGYKCHGRNTSLPKELLASPTLRRSARSVTTNLSEWPKFSFLTYLLKLPKKV